MNVRVRYEDKDGNEAEQVFEKALKVEITGRQSATPSTDRAGDE